MWALHSDCTPAEIVAFLVDMWPEAVKEKIQMILMLKCVYS